MPEQNAALAAILTKINFGQFHARYPILAEVNGRRRSFLLQFAYPTLRVAVEVVDPDNVSKQKLCFDDGAYHFRKMAIEAAGWQLCSFEQADVAEYPEMVEFYCRWALGLGPKPNVLESNVFQRMQNRPEA